MNNSKIDLRFGLIALMIFMAAMSRLLPHPPNFTPIAGMGLFGAAYFSRKYLAFLIPFAAYWVSDLVISNIVFAQYYDSFQWFSHIDVYIGFALIIALGFFLLKKINVNRLLVAGLSSSVIFYLVTNFGSWIGGTTYTKDFSGLMASYVAGIPFFWNTLAGDLFFITVLFGTYELVKRRFPQFATQAG